MAKRQRLTVREVRDAVRLAWEAAELRADAAAQGKFLVDGLARMIGGDFGFWCIIGGCVPGKMPAFVFAAPGSVLPPEVVEYFHRMGRDFSVLEDPVMDFGRYTEGTAVLQMSALLERCEPDAHTQAIDIIRRVRSKDALIAFHRRMGDGESVTALSIHRTEIARRNDARERAIARLVATELDYLHRTGRFEVSACGMMDQLPMRLRRVAMLMMTDRSAKQIAQSLELSVETVRGYEKDLYRVCGVSSRQELILKLIGDSRANIQT